MFSKSVSLICLLLLFLNLEISKSDYNFGYDSWVLRTPPGSYMGLILAVALPLDLPNKNAYMSFVFEAVYTLPDYNASFQYPPVIQRGGIDRKFVYSALERKIETSGYPGKACLLRTICESAVKTVQHANGVLGDILHIVFTPSTSKNLGLSKDYIEAEKAGRISDACTAYHKNCTVSFLDLITWLEKSVS